MDTQFDRMDMWTIRAFLTRTVTRGPQEEDQLINLVRKIDLHLEGNTHVITGTTQRGAAA
jgi:hypothetical protein